MKPHFPRDFEQNYQTLLKRLKLNGLQPKTIEAYSRAVRRAGARFTFRIDALTKQQLTDYFADLLASHSWSTVKLDLYGLENRTAPKAISIETSYQPGSSNKRLDCGSLRDHNLTLLVTVQIAKRIPPLLPRGISVCRPSNLADDDAGQRPRLQRLYLPVEREYCMESQEPDNAEYLVETRPYNVAVSHKP
jgi:hypothetical protein